MGYFEGKLRNYVDVMSDKGIIGTYTVDELANFIFAKEDSASRYWKVRKVFNATTDDIASNNSMRHILNTLILTLTLSHDDVTSIEFFADEDIMLGKCEVDSDEWSTCDVDSEKFEWYR